MRPFSIIFSILAIFASTHLTFASQSFDPIRNHRFTAGSLGVANAVTSIAAYASAFYFNPAGLSRHAEHRIFSLSQHFVDDYKNFGMQGAIIDGKTEDPLHWGFLYNFARTKSVARFHDMILATSYNYNNFILVGVGQRIVNFDRRLITPERWTYGVNFGVLVFATDNIAVGASADNLYRSHRSAVTSPVIFRTGVSANFEKFRVGLDIERDQSNSKTIGRLGGEWVTNQLMQVRTGFFSDTSKRDLGYTFGLGFKPNELFQMNLAFLDQLKSSIKIYATDFVFRF